MSKVEALAKDTAPLFSALGDATRLGLLVLLSAGGPHSVTHLSSGFSLSRQAVTKHLQVLAEAGLVRSRRAGRECLWELEPRRLADAAQLLDALSRQWEAALGRLKTFVEA